MSTRATPGDDCTGYRTRMRESEVVAVDLRKQDRRSQVDMDLVWRVLGADRRYEERRK